MPNETVPDLLTSAVTLGEVGRKVDALAAAVDVLKTSLDDQPRWRDLNALTDRVTALEDTSRWTTRTIGGALVVAAVGGAGGVVWAALGGG